MVFPFLSKSKRNVSPYQGLNDLDRKLEKYLDYDFGYYVELGANDGKSQSNTYYFEKMRRWKGLLVEPFPGNFFKCRTNRSAENAIFCAACVSFDYDKEFVKIIYSNLMSVSMGLDSDIEDPQAHADMGRQFISSSEDIFAFGAQAKTLHELLEAARAPRVIDLLSLDVEGAEMEVLRGIDHEAHRFKYMCIECRNIERINDYLISKNYRLVDRLTEHDYLFGDAG